MACHDGDDKFVSNDEVGKFKHQLDSTGAQYSSMVYPGAIQAFANPAAIAPGKKF